MLNIKLLFYFCILTSVAFSQYKSKDIFFEVINSIESAETNCFISFKAAYNQLVFIKENSNFTAKFTITTEAKDSITKDVIREIVEKKVSTENYEFTTRNDLFVQGLVKLKLPFGKYSILPILNDENSGEEYKLKEIKVDIPQNKNDIINPIIIESSRKESKDSTFVLANNNGSIPFSHNSFDLLFSITDTSVTRINFELFRSDSLVKKSVLDNSFLSSFTLKELEDGIHLVQDIKNSPTRNFILYSVNKNLKEGDYKIIIKTNTEKTMTYQISVVWFTKPNFLDNLSLSVKVLKYIADENDIEKIRNKSEDELYKSLFDYWNKFDPTPQTEFNELMNEFYQRADYAVKNLSVLGTNNGADSDRGRIYLQFGKPADIKRIYSSSNNISEIWIYDNPDRKFIFSDKTGLGNFLLQD